MVYRFREPETIRYPSNTSRGATVQGPEAFAMTSTIGMLCLTVYGLAKAFFNRPSKRLPPTGGADPLLMERLDRMEQAIQAIAIETERIAEGQRFTTRLLARADEPVRAGGGRHALEPGRS